MTATLIGLVAGALTSLAAVPQVVRAYRTKRVRDISIWQPVLLDAGMLLWLYYGVVIGDVPLIAANIFSLACNSILIVLKIIYRGDDKPLIPRYIEENTCVEEES